MTFWGHRSELVVPHKYVVPLSGTNEKADSLAFRVFVEDEEGNQQDFILCTALGGVKDKGAMVEIFGQELAEAPRNQRGKKEE